jgi:hypothetical protein
MLPCCLTHCCVRDLDVRLAVWKWWACVSAAARPSWHSKRLVSLMVSCTSADVDAVGLTGTKRHQRQTGRAKPFEGRPPLCQLRSGRRNRPHQAPGWRASSARADPVILWSTTMSVCGFGAQHHVCCWTPLIGGSGKVSLRGFGPSGKYSHDGFVVSPLAWLPGSASLISYLCPWAIIMPPRRSSNASFDQFPIQAKLLMPLWERCK